MNIILITQNEPFCVHKSLSYLYRDLPESSKISGIALLSPSLSGLTLMPFQTALNTLKLIGPKCTIYCAIKLIASEISGAGVYSFLREKIESQFKYAIKWVFRGLGKR